MTFIVVLIIIAQEREHLVSAIIIKADTFVVFACFLGHYKHVRFVVLYLINSLNYLRRPRPHHSAALQLTVDRRRLTDGRTE